MANVFAHLYLLDLGLECGGANAYEDFLSTVVKPCIPFLQHLAILRIFFHVDRVDWEDMDEKDSDDEDGNIIFYEHPTNPWMASEWITAMTSLPCLRTLWLDTPLFLFDDLKIDGNKLPLLDQIKPWACGSSLERIYLFYGYDETYGIHGIFSEGYQQRALKNGDISKLFNRHRHMLWTYQDQTSTSSNYEWEGQDEPTTPTQPKCGEIIGTSITYEDAVYSSPSFDIIGGPARPMNFDEFYDWHIVEYN
ncbi:hypothetical protein BDN70DRAFT_902054 [Pholiota conissans]|uniref:Uncharacterized protein n=1 Tax=Pholiota conissans TaxID=109636 RepID=A0A9P5YJZ9_9AGAR|nr:hypothetical protein BDN70DRAFT_902054 [Pholiota conissans]